MHAQQWAHKAVDVCTDTHTHEGDHHRLHDDGRLLRFLSQLKISLLHGAAGPSHSIIEGNKPPSRDPPLHVRQCPHLWPIHTCGAAGSEAPDIGTYTGQHPQGGSGGKTLSGTGPLLMYQPGAWPLQTMQATTCIRRGGWVDMGLPLNRPCCWRDRARVAKGFTRC